jgi:hypothetical protein
MKAALLGSAMAAVLTLVGSDTFGQTRQDAEQLKRSIRSLGGGIAQPVPIQDWLRNSEILRATREEFESAIVQKSIQALSKKVSKEQLDNIINELTSKSYTELTVIKIAVDDGSLCGVINCYGIHPENVRMIADGVINGRDKEESVRTANINSKIAISGAVLAILSFAMSVWSTITSFRSKKSATADA